MKAINALVLLSCFAASTAHAACEKVAEGLKPFKGMVTHVTDVSRKWNTSEKYNGTGWVYTWKFQFPGRPTLTTWSNLGGSKSDKAHEVANGDIYLFMPAKNPELVKQFKERNTEGYFPAILHGKNCELRQVDASEGSNTLDY